LFGKEDFLSFPQLKKAVKREGVNAQDVYKQIQKKHSAWPSHPDGAYGDEWASWPNLFGREQKNFLSLPQLKKAVKSEGVNIQEVYFQAQKRYPAWPSTPSRTYGDGWVSWPELFGR
jgi:hypothetical protein